MPTEAPVRRDRIFAVPPADATDHEIAEGIRDYRYPSPSQIDDCWLFALRVTGTGMAYRESLGEWAHRDPETWLSDEFVQRCNGLTVVFQHPETGGVDSQKYREDAIGAIVLPYVEGDEVWGIAKIFDADSAEMMKKLVCSTSPGVTPPAGSTTLTLESGAQVLDEGLPRILDHLAVCELGVWDKGGPPEGVRLDSQARKGQIVADEDREKELKDAKERADAAEKRADAAEGERDDAKKRADEMDKADKARQDAEKEKADAAKRDSRKDRHGKHDADGDKGEVLDCAKCDAEEKEEKEKADKAKKDAEVTPEAGRGTEDIKDSATIKSMQRQIDELTRSQQPLTIEDRDAVSKAFHKYDSLFQMLMDGTPQPLPGESPVAYRKRCANGLRKYTTSFKNYAFHDAQQVEDFGLVENAIFSEALAYAKNPPAADIQGQVREIRDSTTLPGKVISTFVGDPHAVWEPFQPPVQRFLKKVNKPQQQHAAY